jgi:hypothetical protein
MDCKYKWVLIKTNGLLIQMGSDKNKWTANTNGLKKKQMDC